MKKSLVILLILLSAGYGAQAQKFVNDFLNIGVGARAYGMGNAVVASVNNTHAGYWNPAGLALIESGLQPSIMHAELYAGIAKHDYLSVAKPLSDGNRTIGISIIRTGVDDIPNTLNLVNPDGSVDYDAVTTFSAADYALFLSYAQRMKNIENLRVGASAKIVYRQVGNFSNAIGFGIDLGAQYDINDLTIGLQLRDITTTFNAWSFNFTDEEKEILAATGNDIPASSTEFAFPRIIAGAAYTYYFGGKFSILGEANLDITTDGKRNVLIPAPVSFDPHFGVELNYDQMIFLRAGINNMQTATNSLGEEAFLVQPNLGLGLKVVDLTIDMALSRFGDSNDGVYSLIFSLMFDFNKNSVAN